VATRDPKRLRLILAYSLTTLAGVLILRGFYNGEGPHRTVGVHVDSTLNAASLRRHDAVSLPDLTPRLENLRFTEAPTHRGTGRNMRSTTRWPTWGAAYVLIDRDFTNP
jgi:hypothetical protein